MVAKTGAMVAGVFLRVPEPPGVWGSGEGGFPGGPTPERPEPASPEACAVAL